MVFEKVDMWKGRGGRGGRGRRGRGGRGVVEVYIHTYPCINEEEGKRKKVSTR